ncbi:MAG: hypothetical protein GY679_03025 [Mycoplasma sp.]|nr:hypothetical protein [Mycoplasma sp.]
MKNKKILLGTMASMIAVATPIAAVVSCGKKTEKTEIKSIEGTISNLFEQILTQLGNQASAFKPIIKKLSIKKNGETGFVTLGKKMQELLFNEKNIVLSGENDKKSFNEIFKNLKTLFNNDTIIQTSAKELEAWEAATSKAFGSVVTAEQMEKDLENFKMPFDGPAKSPFKGVKKGQDLKPTAKKLNKNIEEVVKMIKQFTHFKTKAETIKKVTNESYFNIATYIMNINPKESISNIVGKIFTLIPQVLLSSQVETEELTKAILELDGKNLSLSLNIFNQKFSLKDININLDSQIKTIVTAAASVKLDGLFKTAWVYVKPELEKVFNPDVKTLKDVIVDGKPLFVSIKKYTTTSKPITTIETQEDLGTLLGKYMDVLGKPEIVKTISDVFELLVSMGDKDQKISNTSLTNKTSIDKVIDGISKEFNIYPHDKSIIKKVFSILGSLAGFYK